jgi:CheY-like chemotaxis protein
MVAATATRPRPVLLVEDDVDEAFLFSQALRSLGNGWELFTVPDLPAAIRCLSAAAADESCRPHVVFVDLHLGARDGTELLEWIAGKPGLAACPALALTEDPASAAAERARTFGAHDVVAKPVSATALGFALARLV